MRITLVTVSLMAGGAERAAVLLSEGMTCKGHEVSLVTLYGTGADFYPVPDSVSRIALGVDKASPTIFHALFNNLHRLWVLRQTILRTQPDIVLSILDLSNVLTILALLNTPFPVIVSEQNDPQQASNGRVWDLLRYLTYPLAAKVVSTSQGVDRYFHWIPFTQRSVIHNPFKILETSKPSENQMSQLVPNRSWLVAMGRLTHQKGFDNLLQAFQLIAPHHPDWHLLILGEGELQAELEQMRRLLGLVQQVSFLGLVQNPFDILKQAQLFVLSSRFEGFGNVMVEALACGLPVVATDCPSGPSEIVRNGIDGLLVPNEDINALAAALHQLMKDCTTREKMAARAPEGVARFTLDTITDQWLTLFQSVMHVPGKTHAT